MAAGLLVLVLIGVTLMRRRAFWVLAGGVAAGVERSLACLVKSSVIVRRRDIRVDHRFGFLHDAVFHETWVCQILMGKQAYPAYTSSRSRLKGRVMSAASIRLPRLEEFSLASRSTGGVCCRRRVFCQAIFVKLAYAYSVDAVTLVFVPFLRCRFHRLMASMGAREAFRYRNLYGTLMCPLGLLSVLHAELLVFLTHACCGSALLFRRRVAGAWLALSLCVIWARAWR